VTRTVRALSMFSGGLDSLLATRVIKDLGVEVVALHFTAPFIRPISRGASERGVEYWRRVLGVTVREIKMGPEFIDVIRAPMYGHGKNLNPCVDCKIFMLRKAATIMETERFDFVVTGEVLGQRPMSQRRDTLAAIEKHSTLRGRLLRPLCAKLLAPTIPEEEGLIDREKLFDFSGRSRAPQLALAAALGIADPPGSAGGCLLTDKNYAKRLARLLSIQTEITDAGFELLTIGRHFDLDGHGTLVVSRNENENHLLERFRGAATFFLEPQDWPGPVALILHSENPAHVTLAARFMARYGKIKPGKTVSVQPIVAGEPFAIGAEPIDEETILRLRINS
jgi:tRNA U34 2-thiouridine synthase MnmA/TrmU